MLWLIYGNWGQVPINSRHAGSVAAHCRCAPMFASARPPCRNLFAGFPPLHFCDYRNTAATKYITEAESEGAFFRAKAQKKIALDGSAKA